VALSLALGFQVFIHIQKMKQTFCNMRDMIVFEGLVLLGRSVVCLPTILMLGGWVQSPLWVYALVGALLPLGFELVLRKREELYFLGMMLWPLVGLVMAIMLGVDSRFLAASLFWLGGGLSWSVLSWSVVLTWPALWRGFAPVWSKDDFERFVHQQECAWRLRVMRAQGMEEAAALRAEVVLIVYEHRHAARTGSQIAWRSRVVGGEGVWSRTFLDVERAWGRKATHPLFLAPNEMGFAKTWYLGPRSAHEMMALVAEGLAAEEEEKARPFQASPSRFPRLLPST
jgi:hypothetical protein